MSEYKIIKDAPLPGAGSPKYPFSEMEIGDSFEFSITEITRVAAAASIWGKRNGTKFTIRKLSREIAGCWRIT